MINGCVRCFANRGHRCIALSDRMDNCSFYKTQEEVDAERLRAAKRLKRLVDSGELDLDSLTFMAPFIKAEIAKVSF